VKFCNYLLQMLIGKEFINIITLLRRSNQGVGIKGTFPLVGSVAKGLNAVFMATAWSRSRDLVQLPPSAHTLLRSWTMRITMILSLLGWKTRKWTTPKQVRIRPKYSVTVAFSWQEDKDRTNNQETIGYFWSFFVSTIWSCVI